MTGHEKRVVEEAIRKLRRVERRDLLPEAEGTLLSDSLNLLDGLCSRPSQRMHGGRTWEEHCRLASEPEGRHTGLHRDSMG